MLRMAMPPPPATTACGWCLDRLAGPSLQGMSLLLQAALRYKFTGSPVCGPFFLGLTAPHLGLGIWMRSRLTTGRLLCACAIVGLSGIVFPRCSQAQTNSWTYPSGGYWDDFRNLSLGVRPASSQVVLITNAPTGLI